MEDILEVFEEIPKTKNYEIRMKVRFNEEINKEEAEKELCVV